MDKKKFVFHAEKVPRGTLLDPVSLLAVGSIATAENADRRSSLFLRKRVYHPWLAIGGRVKLYL